MSAFRRKMFAQHSAFYYNLAEGMFAKIEIYKEVVSMKKMVEKTEDLLQTA